MPFQNEHVYQLVLLSLLLLRKIFYPLTDHHPYFRQQCTCNMEDFFILNVLFLLVQKVKDTKEGILNNLH